MTVEEVLGSISCSIVVVGGRPIDASRSVASGTCLIVFNTKENSHYGARRRIGKHRDSANCIQCNCSEKRMGNQLLMVPKKCGEYISESNPKVEHCEIKPDMSHPPRLNEYVMKRQGK